MASSPSSAPFRTAPYSHEAEYDVMFDGPSSSLSEPMVIKPTLWQRLKSVDWLDWLCAFGALFLVYAIIGSYFYGLLAIAEAIRGDNFRVLPQQYCGAFSMVDPLPIPNGFNTYPAGYNVPWNSSLY